MTGAPPLYGLVLAGGRSVRMGEDKAQLVYREDQTQRETAASLLRTVCERVFLSVAIPPSEPAPETIVDQYPGTGPLNAILSAFEAHAEVAWFVLACDLPFLDETAVRALVERRSTAHGATAFHSAYLDGAEPLCAIYEPILEPALRTAFQDGARCPTDFLKQVNVQLIDPPTADALTNANTQEERKAALRRLGGL